MAGPILGPNGLPLLGPGGLPAVDPACCCGGCDADFSFGVLSSGPPVVIGFLDHSSPLPASWHWDFGDGTTSSLQNPSHAFASGSYYVTLTVTMAGGATCSKSRAVTVGSTTPCCWSNVNSGTLMLVTLSGIADDYLCDLCENGNKTWALSQNFGSGGINCNRWRATIAACTPATNVCEDNVTTSRGSIRVTFESRIFPPGDITNYFQLLTVEARRLSSGELGYPVACVRTAVAYYKPSPTDSATIRSRCSSGLSFPPLAMTLQTAGDYVSVLDPDAPCSLSGLPTTLTVTPA